MALDKREFYMDEDITKARYLPARAFTDKEFLERELETVFRNSWLPAPEPSAAEFLEKKQTLQNIVSVRGTSYPITILGAPLLLRRGLADGELRCFPNVCTHFGQILVQGAERKRTIICPLHGRQFDCQGKFLSQNGFENLPGFPEECDHLKRIGLGAWNQFLFINMGAPVISFGELIKPVDETVAGLAVQNWQRTVYECDGTILSGVSEVDGNWKLHVINYMDVFHVPLVHRAPGGLADAVDMSSYTYEFHKYSCLQWVYARNKAHGFDMARIPKHFNRPVFALWWFLFPNIFFNFYPWGLSLSVAMPVIENPKRTRFFTCCYLLDKEKYLLKDTTWKGKQVNDEDLDSMQKQARGIRSGFVPRGRFAPRDEQGPHWFQRALYEVMFE